LPKLKLKLKTKYDIRAYIYIYACVIAKVYYNPNNNWQFNRGK